MNASAMDVQLQQHRDRSQQKQKQQQPPMHTPSTSISAYRHCYNNGVKCWASLRAWMTFLIPCCSCSSIGLIPCCSCSCSCCRSMACLIPCCTCSGALPSSEARVDFDAESVVVGATVTGTIFGCRKGRVSFCIQEDPRASPLMLLELAIPTNLLVKEMSSGLLSIALECERDPHDKAARGRSLYAEPVWSMLCNGRKVGFASKRRVSESDKAVLGMMQAVSMGAGVIPLAEGTLPNHDDELMYMRAPYERVVGSCDSESFHMINPEGSPGQELSIFLLRS